MRTLLKTICIISLTILCSCNNQETPTKNQSRETLIETISQTGDEIQKFPIFDFHTFEKIPGQIFGLISLSEIDQLSENEDSTAIPNIKGLSREEIEYLSLDSVYRKRFLYRTHISESDTLYIYDYYSNILQKISVSNLTVSASLSGYAEATEDGYSQFDYHIGFEIAPEYLKVDGQEICGYGYAYVGKKNPFIIGGMYPIRWERISLDKFPKTTISKEEQENLKGYKEVEAYKFSSTEYHYYLKQFTSDNYYSRQLVVKSTKSNKTVYMKFFHDRDFVEYAPLNYIDSLDAPILFQFSGRLLKNKPPVFFGLQLHSAGCPSIYFMDEKDQEIEILCDNRH